MENQARSERYHRQVILKELGEAGQYALLRSRVLVVGAGGLGCPVLQYLAAAGVGTLGIIDGDRVALSNLHRQVLYTSEDVGHPKAMRAAARVKELNPGVDAVAYPYLLDTANALEIVAQYDVIVDATDNFPARYLVNDACVLLGKPLVQGAVSRYEGQLAVFNHATGDGERPVNYRDLFPAPPKGGEVANCEKAGVLGVLPAIIGSMQAAEVIKLVTGIGRPLSGRLQTFNMLTSEWYTWDLPVNPDAEGQAPGTEAGFRRMSYEAVCGLSGFTELEPAGFESVRGRENVTVIDVREAGELPLIDEFAHLQVPLAALEGRLGELHDPVLVAVCQTGARSRAAAALLADKLPGRTIYSLRGGIVAWKQQYRTA
ncbi:MAG TPA: HesA/MoeB/ThiF family protein [Sphingobacteriaceae bacterium]